MSVETPTTTGAAGPLVSIGLPCYRRPEALQVALRSLLAQTYRNLEIFVHENPSEVDGIEAAVREVAGDDPRVVFRRHSENIGPSGNFESVLNRANGPYFMWAADDDEWHPEFVERPVERLEADPAYIAAASGLEVVDARGARLSVFDRFSRFDRPDRAERLRAYLAEPELLGKANLIYGLYRTEAVREAWAVWKPTPALTVWGSDIVLVFAAFVRGPWAFVDRVLMTKRSPKVSKRRSWQAFPEDFGPPTAVFDDYEAALLEVCPDDAARDVVRDVMSARRRRLRWVSSWRRPLGRMITRLVLAVTGGARP